MSVVTDPGRERQARARTRGRRLNGAGHLPIILVVDDAPENLLAMEGLLRRDDVEIVTAKSGREALEVLLERDVAVAIVDVMMPDMDGFELADLIRGVDRTRHVPIIFVTASSRADYKTFTGYKSGAIDFLFKPIDEQVLRAKVEVLVTLDKQQGDLERARAQTEALLRLAQATSKGERAEDIYGPALDAVQDLLGAERSAILLFDDSHTMRFRAWKGLSDAYRSAVDGHSPWSAGERNPEPLLISDVTRDDRMAPYREVFAAEGIRAIAFVPLLAHGELLGKFMVYWDETRPFFPRDESLALAISAEVAEALERAHLREAERTARAAAEAAVAELKQTLRENELFAGVLAHDLRNPLGAILTSTEVVLRRHETDDAIEGPLRRVVSSGARMTRLIDQLLDFTRARVGGRIDLHLRETSLADVCKQAVGELEAAHASWRISVEAVGDLRGTWDPDRLLQVVSNLVGNAGQHGAPGGSIRLKLDGTDKESLRLEVHNDGAIPEAIQPTLFAPFRGTRERKSSSGLGLGLFIAKDIVVGHGGDLRLVSSDSGGTVFEVRLPRHATGSAGPDGPRGGAVITLT